MGKRNALLDVAVELATATAMHGSMCSGHEGWAVIKEELDELWEEVRKQKPGKETDIAAMRKEAIQVAAMAVRFVEDVCDRALAGEGEVGGRINVPVCKKHVADVQAFNVCVICQSLDAARTVARALAGKGDKHPCPDCGVVGRHRDGCLYETVARREKP